MPLSPIYSGRSCIVPEPGAPGAAPVPPPTSTTALLRAGAAALAAHGAILAFDYWLLYRYFAARTFPGLESALRTAFTQHVTRLFVSELAMLAAVVIGAAIAAAAIGLRAGPARVAAVALASYGAAVAYGVLLAAAMAFGWEPNVFVMSAVDAVDSEAAAAIAEALPYVLAPLALARLAAAAGAGAFFGWLLTRTCDTLSSRAATMAAVYVLAAIAAHLLVLGVPETL